MCRISGSGDPEDCIWCRANDVDRAFGPGAYDAFLAYSKALKSGYEPRAVCYTKELFYGNAPNKLKSAATNAQIISALIRGEKIIYEIADKKTGLPVVWGAPSVPSDTSKFKKEAREVSIAMIEALESLGVDTSKMREKINES